MNPFSKYIKKRNKLILNVITLNRAEKLEKLLSKCYGHFDEMRVCDGGSSDNTIDICKKYSCRIAERQWDDNFAAQHNVLLDLASPGERIFILDDDEYPSEQLLKRLPTLLLDYDDYNQLYIPNILVLNDIPLFPSVDEFIRKVKEEGHEQFCKQLYVIYQNGIQMDGNCHCGLIGNEWKPLKIAEPIIHDKTTLNLIWGYIYQSFIRPDQHGISEKDGNLLQELFHKEHIFTTQQLQNYLDGDISEELKDLFITWQHPNNGELKRFFQYYFLAKHPKEYLKIKKLVYDETIASYIRDISGYDANTWWECGIEYLSTKHLSSILQQEFGWRYPVSYLNQSISIPNPQDTVEWWETDEIVNAQLIPGDYDTTSLVEMIRNWCAQYGVADNAAILEIGSGGGRLLMSWAAFSTSDNKNFVVEGVEHSKRIMENAKGKLPDITMYNMCATKMNFVNKYDVVYTCATLQHNSEHKKKLILNNIYRALKDNGLLWLVNEGTLKSDDIHKLSHPCYASGMEGTAIWWIGLISNYGFELLYYEHGSYVWRKL